MPLLKIYSVLLLTCPVFHPGSLGIPSIVSFFSSLFCTLYGNWLFAGCLSPNPGIRVCCCSSSKEVLPSSAAAETAAGSDEFCRSSEQLVPHSIRNGSAGGSWQRRGAPCTLHPKDEGGCCVPCPLIHKITKPFTDQCPHQLCFPYRDKQQRWDPAVLTVYYLIIKSGKVNLSLALSSPTHTFPHCISGVFWVG